MSTEPALSNKEKSDRITRPMHDEFVRITTLNETARPVKEAFVPDREDTMDEIQYVNRIMKTRRNSFWENIADESDDII